MRHEEIELNFDASCQQILGLESEILWQARSTPTLKSQRTQHNPGHKDYQLIPDLLLFLNWGLFLLSLELFGGPATSP
jgi:hypothetical protein